MTRTIKLTEEEIKLVKSSLDKMYEIGLEAINDLRQVGISETTIKMYVSEIEKYANLANKIQQQIN